MSEEPRGEFAEVQHFDSVEELKAAAGERATVVETAPELALPPLQIGVQRDPRGLPVVLLTVATAFGAMTYPLSDKIARQIGAQLQTEGSAAAAKLTTVTKPGLILPGR